MGKMYNGAGTERFSHTPTPLYGARWTQLLHLFSVLFGIL